MIDYSATPICYGSTKYTSFTSPKSGQIVRLTFLHLSGNFDCSPTILKNTEWGCFDQPDLVISNSNNELRKPTTVSSTTTASAKPTETLKVTSQATTTKITKVVLGYSPPIAVKQGREFRLWTKHNFLMSKGNIGNTYILNGNHCVQIEIGYLETIKRYRDDLDDAFHYRS